MYWVTLVLMDGRRTPYVRVDTDVQAIAVAWATVYWQRATPWYWNIRRRLPGAECEYRLRWVD